MQIQRRQDLWNFIKWGQNFPTLLGLGMRSLPGLVSKVATLHNKMQCQNLAILHILQMTSNKHRSMSRLQIPHLPFLAQPARTVAAALLLLLSMSREWASLGSRA